jgi:CRP/FNR family transcriptional regulator, cyclic AMP receptor protein
MKKNLFDFKTFLATATESGKIEDVPRNQVLFVQGKRGNAVFYIRTGIVALTVASAAGKERIVSLLGPGSFAGKECLAEVHAQSILSAKALTSCSVLKIEREEMLRLLRSQQMFASLFVDYLLNRVMHYQEIVTDHLFDSSAQRLARTLLFLTNLGEGAEPEAIVPGIRQRELAEVVGTTRSRVSHFMNCFRSLGLVAYESRGPITVHIADLSRWLTSAKRSID